MTARGFRFGVVTAMARTGAEWLATAQRAEALGYDTLLVPDTLHTLAPLPALAAAAVRTQRLRVGTYVLSAPNRSPGLVAWETDTLDLLTDGRYELGLGGGRPGADRDAAVLGGHFGTPAERLQRVAETIRAVRQRRPRGPQEAPCPPIMVAASKPRMLRLAAEQADIVAFGLPPQAPEDELAGAVAMVRNFAGARFDSLELHINIFAVAAHADAVPEGLSRLVGGDPRAMAAAGGYAFLLGTPSRIADVLRRRRAELGISYVAVNGLVMEDFAAVIAELRGDR
jgi:probable F420-dependent oxidoreductase